MKKLMIALIAATAAAWSSYAAAPIAPSEISAPANEPGRIEIGTRIITYRLEKNSSGGRVSTTTVNGQPVYHYAGTFIGSLEGMDEKQDYAPTRLYAQYFFNDYFGIGASYDHVEAKTLKMEVGGTDGNIGIEGPILYVVGRYPNETRFVPFAELGVAFYHAYFNESALWRDQESDNFERRMENKDTQALVIGLGADYQITDNWSVNLYARTVQDATVDVEAWYKKAEMPFATGHFPMDYYGAGVGVKYTFK